MNAALGKFNQINFNDMYIKQKCCSYIICKTIIAECCYLLSNLYLSAIKLHKTRTPKKTANFISFIIFSKTRQPILKNIANVHSRYIKSFGASIMLNINLR